MADQLLTRVKFVSCAEALNPFLEGRKTRKFFRDSNIASNHIYIVTKAYYNKYNC